eukprot:4277737-Amphidinium_carterae.1
MCDEDHASAPERFGVEDPLQKLATRVEAELQISRRPIHSRPNVLVWAAEVDSCCTVALLVVKRRLWVLRQPMHLRRPNTLAPATPL